MSLTGSGGIGGSDWQSFRQSLEGPADNHPRRQDPPDVPLYVRLQRRADAISLAGEETSPLTPKQADPAG